MEIEYEPRFLDEVVLRAVAARPEGRLFHRERERAYRLGDPEERARAFDTLNAAWCVRLDLARPLYEALAAVPHVVTGVARCAVGRPPRPGDAGAELLVRAPAPGEPAAAAHLLRLLFAPELFGEPERLGRFLDRELLHVADMLDPRFGYVPHLPPAPGGPAHDRLQRDRYRVVWNATVDGRLARAGRLPVAAREERRAEFARTFATPGRDGQAAFDGFFDDPTPTHAAIAAFVTNTARRGDTRGACALCGLPTVDLDPDLAALPAATLDEIAREVPGWTPAQGCCRQCADLYRARPLALAGAAALPGVR